MGAKKDSAPKDKFLVRPESERLKAEEIRGIDKKEESKDEKEADEYDGVDEDDELEKIVREAHRERERLAKEKAEREAAGEETGEGDVEEEKCEAAEEEHDLSQEATGEGEEGRVSKGVTNTMRVTKEEREAHERTHTPFRSWCPYCVKGRASNAPHMQKKESQEERSRQVPRVSMDYFFMSEKDRQAKESPVLVAVNEITGERYARAVGMKGIGQEGEMEWLIKDMSEEMKVWGHQGGSGGKLIIKSDGEASIKALSRAIGRFHGEK